MGREIEMKIPLKWEEFLTVYKFIYKQIKIENIECQEVQLLFKQDQYFSRFETRTQRIENNEPQVIRIRTEESIQLNNPIVFSENEKDCISEVFKTYRNNSNNKNTFFTIKRKKKENGIELNKEDETEIQDASVLIDFFKIADYKCWFNKEKCSWSCYCKSSVLKDVDFHLELEAVNNLLYLEVEVIDMTIDADLIKEKIAEFISLFGINPQNKDSRSWVEILSK